MNINHSQYTDATLSHKSANRVICELISDCCILEELSTKGKTLSYISTPPKKKRGVGGEKGKKANNPKLQHT